MKLDAQIKKILWEDWDPIGVNDAPGAIDEYDSCALSIFGALHKEETTKDEIKEYLLKIETEHMGLKANEPVAEKVAQKLVELKKN